MTNEARNVRIADEYLNTDRTLQDIGDEYGMTRERVRQIVNLVYPNRENLKKWQEMLPRVWEEAATATSFQELSERLDGEVLPHTLSTWGRSHVEYSGLSALLQKNKKLAKARQTHKKCSTCGQVKLMAEFGKYRYQCRACNNAKAKKYYRQREPVEEPTVSEKTCPACLRLQPAGQFYRMRRASDGLQTHCKDCSNRLGDGETVKEIRESYGYQYKRTRFR